VLPLSIKLVISSWAALIMGLNVFKFRNIHISTDANGNNALIVMPDGLARPTLAVALIGG